MSGKLDRRRARARRIQRVILGLHARGYSVKGIAQQAGVSTQKVERTLDNLLPAPATQPSQQERISQVNINQVKTERDLKKWLDLQQQQLAEISQQINELKTQSSTRRLELTE